MSETAFDFMKIWTQSDEKLEIRIETVLRDSLDSVVQLRDASTSRILDRNPMNSPPRVGINGGLFTALRVSAYLACKVKPDMLSPFLGL